MTRPQLDPKLIHAVASDAANASMRRREKEGAWDDVAQEAYMAVSDRLWGQFEGSRG